jgi:hypothetical protein
MEVSGVRHPAALYPRERTFDTHWIGGWVDLRAGQNTEARASVGNPVAKFAIPFKK